MSWSVRAAQEAELPLLPDIERAAARLFPPDRIPDPDLAHDVEELAGYRAEGLLWVGADGAEVMGFVIARELDGALHIYELAVHPRFGRRGIGTGLTRRAMAEAGHRALPRVTLTTFEDLPWNAPFYQRLGFRVLAPAELPVSLGRLLEAERAAGMVRRVAMSWTGPEDPVRESSGPLARRAPAMDGVRPRKGV